MHSLDARSAIKLVAKNLVGLAEPVEFSSEISVLSTEARAMFLKSFFLCKEISVVVAVLILLDSLTFNIAASCEETFFTLAEAKFSVTNLNRKVTISAFSEIKLFAEIVVFSRNTFVIAFKVSVVFRKLRVCIASSGELTLSVFETTLLSTQVRATDVYKLLSVLNSCLSSLELVVKSFDVVVLIARLCSFCFVVFLEVVDFSPHLSSLVLDTFNLSVEISSLSTEVGNLITFCNGFISQTASFKEFLVKKAFGSLKFVIQVQVLLGFFGKQEFEVVELLARVGDLVTSTVEASSVFVLRAGLVVTKHAVSVLHGENFVINTSVVSVLVAEIVQLLAELSNKLIFLG